MTLFEAVFGEAIDRDAQQKRLNKVALPLKKREKAVGDELFKLRSDPYHDVARAGRGDIKLGGIQDSLERVKKLKTLVTARTKKDENPEDEKLQRKVDNADDARQSWRGRAWPRKTSLW
jgi:hypothetical protein